MANVKFIAVSRGLKGILEYVKDREKTIDSLISGVNCVGETALDEFEAVKKQFRKTDGRGYYHIVQSFSPDDPLDFDTAHEIGVKFAEYFKGYQCVVVTHMNTEHIHNHIIMNSVNYETGQKYHQSARDMQMAKEFSNQLCLQYGLSITETKADRNRIPAWKKKLRDDIRKAMAQSYDTLDFVWYMESWGYKVKWEVGEKYITYTTPENIKCRDNKLFDDTLLRENMEHYFTMGGCRYLEERRAYEPNMSVDDAVQGLASIFQALSDGDEVRFHMETIHHSEDEIDMLLRRGKKIEKVQYAVSDEDEEEEYQRYHGFNFGMSGF